jgi:hypothetical protein
MDYEADSHMPVTPMEWIEQSGIMLGGLLLICLVVGFGTAIWHYLEAAYYEVKHWFALRRIAREERAERLRRGW